MKLLGDIRTAISDRTTVAALALAGLAWSIGALIQVTNEIRREHSAAEAELAGVTPLLYAARDELAGVEDQITQRRSQLAKLDLNRADPDMPVDPSRQPGVRNA